MTTSANTNTAALRSASIDDPIIDSTVVSIPSLATEQRRAERQIVVAGGGAGGLELAVKLGRKFRRDRQTEVLLVDKNPTHIWKPLLHEVATGSMNSYHDEASYRLLAKKHGFRFMLGRITNIDPLRRSLTLASVDDGDGREVMPGRKLDYDYLAVSVGSQSNDYGIDGVATHSMQLDSREQAEVFHKEFTRQLHRVNAELDRDAVLSVVIIGGGATGVELAADMHNVVQRLREYGFEHLSSNRLVVSIIEAAPGLLPRLPDRIGYSVQRELARIGVDVRILTRVARVTDDAVHTSEGVAIPADISVWAAGVKAPSWLSDCGFPTDRLGRIEVNKDLSVKGMPEVFALGDCCSCYNEDGTEVPPRAQAAHQMASIAARNIRATITDKTTKDFVYRDFGSLVSLSKFSTIGNLMGNLVRGTVFVEGFIARMVYVSLYRLHQRSIHGSLSTLLIMLGDRIYKATRADVKLH
ncbi:MAG: NAD(P)/FAD-dependent oxidoreductase [Woeseiaceae bacterium]|nr:NAD(P)/FAD-dependent oxidoreductase [Woeseiaceae bacterium]